MVQPPCAKSIIVSLSLSLYFFVFLSPLIIAMKKVHPIPTPSKHTRDTDPQSPKAAPKRLRRLAHVFAKTLELPFPANANVTISETHERLKFVVDTGIDDMTFRVVESFPGVTKIVVHAEGDDDEDEDTFLRYLEEDSWRLRLPGDARLDMATAIVRGGKLVVTVPMDGCEGLHGSDGGLLLMH